MHLENLPFNYEEAVAVLLFVIGFCMLLFSRNLIKKVIGLDIMDSGIFLLTSLRQHQFRGHAADIQGVTVHPDQSILGGYAAGGLRLPRKTTPGPHRQGGIAVGGEVLHLPEGAQLSSCPPIQP